MDIQIIALKKNGDIEKLAQNVSKLPSVGDGIMVGKMGCEVRGHVYTPHLPHEYHVFVSEC